jgi:hypothetical protein
MYMQLEHVFAGDSVGRGEVQDERTRVEKRRGRRRKVRAIQLTKCRVSWLWEGSRGTELFVYLLHSESHVVGRRRVAVPVYMQSRICE